ncbi:MAG TPA: nuclear transport factor 2 family protein [Gemmatimonadales bacterium]
MDIAGVIERYHSACDAFAIGDPAPIKALYARSEDVLLANPFGGASRGWTAVSEALDFASSNFRDGQRVRFEEVSRYSSTDLVSLFEREHWETKVGARTELAPFDLRVTTTFRLFGGDWKVVSRHADPLTTPHPDGPLRTSA